MKKLLTFFLLTLLAFSVGWAATETFTFSQLGYANQAEVTTVSGSNVTLVFNKGTNSNPPKYFTSGAAVRCYGGNYFTVNSTQTMSSIVITFGSSDGSNAITTDVATYSNGTWTGSASSVKFTIGGTSGNRRIAAIAVTYSSGGSTQTCEAPVFSLADGKYFGTQTVSITSETDGASIYYTTDGSTPSASNGTLYTAPISVETSVTLKAIAVKSGNNDSGVSIASYDIISGSSVFHKVTNSSQMVANRKYILVYPGTLENHSEIALMGAKTGNYCSYLTGNDLAISNGIIDVAGYEPMVLSLGGSTGAWTFKIDNTDDYFAWGGTSTYVATSAELNANAQWAVNTNQSGTDYWITNVGSSANGGSSRSIIANVASSANPMRFACYANVASTQTYALLFYQDDGTNPTTLTVSPDSLPIGNNGGSLTVNASYLTQDLSVTASTDFSATPGTLSANGSYPVNVTVNYTGRALGAEGTVTVGNTSDNLSDTVDVKYVYDGSLYILGWINSNGWAPNNAAAMTYNSGTGWYTANISTAPYTDGYSYISFSKRIADSWDEIYEYRFVPVSNNNNWWLIDESIGVNHCGEWCPLDFDPAHVNNQAIKMPVGSYEVSINPATNEFCITPKVANPVIEPATGLYREPQTVTISCATPGATIYYTTDGSVPTTSSAVYNGSFTVSATTTVKAIAVSNGLTSDPVESVITIKSLSNTYVLVTNTDDIVANDDYVLVYSRSQNNTDYAMSNSYNESSHFYSTVTNGFTLANEVVSS